MQRRTNIQNSKMFGLASKLGLSHEDLRDLAFEVSGERTDHTSELSVKEADRLIERLEKLLPAKKEPSKRTVQYRRQVAGIEQIATATHLDWMNTLARGRSMSEQGLGDLSAKVNGGNRKPRTSKEVNRVIEAIKAMNRRAKTFGAFKKDEKEAA